MRRHAMKRQLSFVAALGMCFFASIPAAYAQVRADTGGIAIGGSVTGSNINIRGPPEKLAPPLRQAADLSGKQKKVIAKIQSQTYPKQSQNNSTPRILWEK